MSKRSSANYVYGFHAVESLFQCSPTDISQIYLLRGRQDKRLQQIQRLASDHQLTIKWLDRQQLDAMVDGNHQGVVIRAQQRVEVYDEAYLKNRLYRMLDQQVVPFILVLDGVTDPHNLGACLRSAEAAGVQLVIAPKDHSAPLNDTAIKVASGAAAHIPLIRVTNLVRTLQWLQQQGVWLLGTADGAMQHYFQADMTGPLALVMGSEGMGLRRLTRETCDSLVAIPMAGSVSSLNVSVATGVCLFEAVRQRQT